MLKSNSYGHNRGLDTMLRFNPYCSVIDKMSDSPESLRGEFFAKSSHAGSIYDSWMTLRIAHR